MSELQLTQVIEVGDSARCDFCGDEYRGRPDPGGILFQSKAVCPQCAPKLEADAALYGETSFIRARCPPGVSFHAWVMGLRGGDNAIKVYTA